MGQYYLVFFQCSKYSKTIQPRECELQRSYTVSIKHRGLTGSGKNVCKTSALLSMSLLPLPLTKIHSFPNYKSRYEKMIWSCHFTFPKIGLNKAFNVSTFYKYFVLERRDGSNHTDHMSVMSKDSALFLMHFYNSFCRGICYKTLLSLGARMETHQWLACFIEVRGLDKYP